jgi:hypothetical protein
MVDHKYLNCNRYKNKRPVDAIKIHESVTSGFLYENNFGSNVKAFTMKARPATQYRLNSR